jgi:hypothetical protein
MKPMLKLEITVFWDVTSCSLVGSVTLHAIRSENKVIFRVVTVRTSSGILINK